MRMNYKNSSRLSILKTFIFTAISLALITCESEPEDKPDNSIVSNPNPDNEVDQNANNFVDSVDSEVILVSQYSFQTIFTEQQGWGYQLLDNGKVFINQPHIPAVQGNKGFSSEEKAIICAEFALMKVDEGMIPPTLTKIELDSLGVLD
jgi:Domain of unknown function (DUF4907)